MPLTTSAPNTIHTFSTEMIEDLSPREVERRFREADRTTELGSRVRAFYASDMRRRRTYKAMGYKRFAEYAASGSDACECSAASAGVSRDRQLTRARPSCPANARNQGTRRSTYTSAPAG